MFLNWWQHEVYGVTSSELRRKPEAGTAHTGVSSHQPYSPSGDTSPEAPSPEIGSGIRNVPIVYPSGAAAPYASYSSNSSASSSSSSHRATYIPYSSPVSSHSKTVTMASVQNAVFDDDDIDAQCLAELEMVEKAYFEKKQREKEIEMNRDRERERDSAHDDQTTQPTQQQWSPAEVACNDLDMQIEPSHESEPHSQDTADADADADTHSDQDQNDHPHSQEE